MTGAKQLVGTLKLALRINRITYKEIAKKLGLSEASIKRNFSIGEMSLGRLEKICSLLGIGVLELAQMATGADRPFPSHLSEAQEQALADDVSLFVLFHLLLRGDTVAQIGASHGLSDAELAALLTGLGELGLLEVGRRPRVRLLVSRCVRWRPKGPLLKRHGKSVLGQFFAAEFTGDDDDDLRFLTARMPLASRKLIQEKIARLSRDIEAIADLGHTQGELPGDSFNILLAYRPMVLELRFPGGDRKPPSNRD